MYINTPLPCVSAARGRGEYARPDISRRRVGENARDPTYRGTGSGKMRATRHIAVRWPQGPFVPDAIGSQRRDRSDDRRRTTRLTRTQYGHAVRRFSYSPSFAAWQTFPADRIRHINRPKGRSRFFFYCGPF